MKQEKYTIIRKYLKILFELIQIFKQIFMCSEIVEKKYLEFFFF